MAQVPTLFLAIAAVTLVGFVAGRIFQTTRFPDIPVLLAIGLLLGPLNRAAVASGSGVPALADFLDPDVLRPMAPYVSALALIVILFESGLKLDVAEFGASIRPAVVHTLPTMVLTVVAIGLVGRFALGMPALVAVVLAVALSNVGQTVSAAVLRHMNLSEGVRSIYFVEMALYDLISIPILVGLLKLGEGVADPTAAFQGFAVTLSVSLSLGVTCGLTWIYALRRLREHPNSYMLTLAAMLILYGGNELLGGSGAVSILLFGLVVGNGEAIMARLAHQKQRSTAEDPKVQNFHGEIAFFVRTFFFLFLGINFSTGAGGDLGLPDVRWFGILISAPLAFLTGVTLIVLAIIGARYAAVRLISARKRPERRTLFPVFGRGLGTAVLATLPCRSASYVPGTEYYELFRPWEAVFLNTALLVVLLTVMVSSGLVWWHEVKGDAPVEFTESEKAERRAP